MRGLAAIMRLLQLVILLALGAIPAAAQESGAPLGKGASAAQNTGQNAADMEVWQEQVREIVDANLNFPLVARLHREGGTTGIRLIIDRSGRIESASVEQSSGNEDVDDITQRMFERLTFPPLPASYSYSKLSFLYTIEYKFSWH